MTQRLLIIAVLLALTGAVRAQAADEQPPPPRRVAEDEPLPLVEFRDVPLDEAVRLLSQQSGLKIVPSSDAGKIRISLYLQNVRAAVAVASIAQANGLIIRRDEQTDIIRIFTSKEVSRDLSSFRDEQIKVFTLLYPNAFDAAQSIRDLFGERVELSFGVDASEEYEDIQDRFDRFDIVDARSQGLGVFRGGVGGGFGAGGAFGVAGGFGGGFGNIGGGLGTGGGVGVAGGRAGFGNFSGRTSSRSGLTRFTSDRNERRDRRDDRREPTARLEGFTAEELQAIEDAAVGREGADRGLILQLLRRRPATIYVTVVPRNNQVVVRTSDPTTMAQICDLLERLDVPTPLLLLEVKVLSIDLSDNFRSVFDYQFADDVLLAGGFTTGNILPPLADIGAPAPQRFQVIAPQGTGLRSRDLYFQIVNRNFRARLQLLESKNRVTEVATPFLMTANNEVNRIFSGRSIPITVGFTPGQFINTTLTTSTTVTSTPITVLQDIGTTLLMTPSINADRTVTIRLLQETSRVIPNGATVPIPNSTGAGFTSVPIDVVDRRVFSGTVVASDGNTIAIGGLIEEGVNDQREEVPILGKIPGLGFFFRGQDTNRFKRELVILIRPFVLNTACEAPEVSRRLIEELSIHPNVVSGDLSVLGTYTPAEVLRPNPPQTELQKIFRTHIILPKDF